MRVLITGGAGFIGSHLAEALLASGEKVSIVDDLSTGSIHNIRYLASESSFEYVIDSVANRRLMAELVDAADAVVHLAAAVGVRLIVESPTRTIETNIEGTDVVLREAAKKRKRVMIASTSEVYGKSNAAPFREGDDLVLGCTTKARWAYACSKAIDEFLAIAYWREKRVPTTVVRLFNTVGPRQTGRYGMVIPSFVRQGLSGDPITVYGDGRQSRCFAHVADVVAALQALLVEDRAVGEVYNVGNDEEIEIGALAERVRARTGGASPISFIPYDEAYEEGFEDMKRRVPALEKIAALIGYAPKKTLDDILSDVIEHESTRLTSEGKRAHRIGEVLEPAR